MQPFLCHSWFAESHLANGASDTDTLRIAMAGQDSLSGAGVLVFLRLLVLPQPDLPDTTKLTMASLLFNEGNPAASTADGVLRRASEDGLLHASFVLQSLDVDPGVRDTLRIRVVDSDGPDRLGLRDTRFGRLPVRLRLAEVPFDRLL